MSMVLHLCLPHNHVTSQNKYFIWYCGLVVCVKRITWRWLEMIQRIQYENCTGIVTLNQSIVDVFLSIYLARNTSSNTPYFLPSKCFVYCARHGFICILFTRKSSLYSSYTDHTLSSILNLIWTYINFEWWWW